MQIKVPFNQWSLDRMARGEKTATTRNKRYGEIGDSFVAGGMRFDLVGIFRVTLDLVSEKWYQQEGCETPEKFRDVWSAIHPRKGFVPGQKVWLHTFKKRD